MAEICVATKKVCHPGKGSALRARARMQDKLSAYLCKACGRWHLGHRTPRGRR